MRGASLLLLLALQSCGGGNAAPRTLVFDFGLGLDPNFTVDQNRAFWDVRTDVSGLRISKPADDGSTFNTGIPGVTSEFFNGHDSVGGASSVFTIDGDFSVTVTYEWNAVETPAVRGDDAVALWITPPGDLALRVQVKNYAFSDGAQYANMNFTGSSTKTLSGAPLRGKLVIERVGTVLSGFATGGDGTLSLITALAEDPVSGPVQIHLFGLQNRSAASARGPMDVSLNHLVVEADSVEGLLPVR